MGDEVMYATIIYLFLIGFIVTAAIFTVKACLDRRRHRRNPLEPPTPE